MMNKMKVGYDNNNAESTLLAFMRDLNAWEMEFYAVKRENLSKGVLRLDIYSEYVKWLEGILREYAIEGKVNWGRLNDMGCMWPATYDVKRDSLVVLSQDERRAVIEVKEGVSSVSHSRFYLSKSKGVWMIQKLEMLTYDGTWSRVPL